MSDYYDQTPEQRRQLRAQRNRRRQALLTSLYSFFLVNNA